MSYPPTPWHIEPKENFFTQVKRSLTLLKNVLNNKFQPPEIKFCDHSFACWPCTPKQITEKLLFLGTLAVLLHHTGWFLHTKVKALMILAESITLSLHITSQNYILRTLESIEVPRRPLKVSAVLSDKNWTIEPGYIWPSLQPSQTMMESDFSCWTLLWRCVLLDLQKLPVRANAHFEAVNGLVSLKIGVLPIKIEQIEMQNK